MLEAGNYYACIRKSDKNDAEVNSFIDAVFSSTRKYRDYGRKMPYVDVDDIGVFRLNHIYKCTIDGSLVDENGTTFFVGKYSRYVFQKIEFDLTNVEGLLTKLIKTDRSRIQIRPYMTMGTEIMYFCKVFIFGGKGNTGVAEGIGLDKEKIIIFTYKNARKNLLHKTKLFKSI